MSEAAGVGLIRQMLQSKSLICVAQKQFCSASNAMSAAPGMATAASSTGGASDARVGVQPQEPFLADAHFMLTIPDRGTMMFKVEKNADGKLVFISVNEVDHPVEVLSRLQKVTIGPHEWFKDGSSIVNATSVVTNAEMLPPTGAVNMGVLTNFVNWVETDAPMDDRACMVKPGTPFFDDVGQCQNKLPNCDVFGVAGFSDNEYAIGDWNSERPRCYETKGGNRDDTIVPEKIDDPNQPGQQIKNPAYHRAADYPKTVQNRMGCFPYCWMEFAHGTGHLHQSYGRSRRARRHANR